MSRSAKVSRRAKWRSAGAAAGIALIAMISGCGPDLAGAAAVVGQTRITDETVADQAASVVDALHLENSNALNRAVIQRLMTQELVGVMAAQHDIHISQGDVDAAIAAQAQQAGGRDQLNVFLLRRFGIGAEQVNDWMRFQLELVALQEKLAPGKDAQAQGEAVFSSAIGLSDDLDARVSPRFGTWDPRSLTVQPPADDLSKPPPALEQTQLTPQLQ